MTSYHTALAAREKLEPSVFIVEASDPCTREHSIIAVFPGTFEGEQAAHEMAERLDREDPSGPDHSVDHWPLRLTQHSGAGNGET